MLYIFNMEKKIRFSYTSPHIRSLFVIWTQCFRPLISVHFLLYGLNIFVTVCTLFSCYHSVVDFFLASYLGIVKNFLKRNLNDILSFDTLSKRYVAPLLSMLWCYISATTCQIIFLTCQICMLFFRSFIITCQIFMFICHLFIFFKKNKNLVLALFMPYRSKENYLTSRHNIWKVKIKIL